MRDLFIEPGIAHSIMVFAVVIALGLYLGKFKLKGISIGSTWILFTGILLSHFGVRVDATVLNFMKDFGLILFVFSIGLQVGPGFFHSFKKGGLTLNMLALCLAFLGAGVTFVLHLLTKEDLPTMVGVMSGAVTNTPGLGAAQQTLADSMHGSQHLAADIVSATSGLASAYALAYPIGLLGVIAPQLIGGGGVLNERLLVESIPIGALLVIFAVRWVLGPFSYSAGTPGGLFAPLLLVGAAGGTLIATTTNALLPAANLSATAFAIVGMSTFFAATVRAPFTGVVLIIEMTATTSVLVPMVLAAGVSVLVATKLKGPPIYETLRLRMENAPT